MAEALIARLRVKNPAEIDIEKIAALHGLLIDFAALCGEQGHLLRSGGVGTLTINVTARESWKWRFVAAHEIGHFLLHPGRDQLGFCKSSDFNQWYQSTGAEPEANVFAAELLMPSALFRRYCGTDRPSLREIKAAAEAFRTTLSSTALRFPRFSAVPCAVAQCTNAGAIEWWNASEEFGFTLKRGRRLGSGTFAHDILSGGSEDQFQPSIIDADEWSDDSRAEGVEIYEHSMRLGRFGSLSILSRQE